MRLSETVIGILPQNDDLHLGKGRQIERPKIFRSFGKDTLADPLLGKQEILELRHVRAGKFSRERRLPAFFKRNGLFAHRSSLFNRMADGLP